MNNVGVITAIAVHSLAQFATWQQLLAVAAARGARPTVREVQRAEKPVHVFGTAAERMRLVQTVQGEDVLGSSQTVLVKEVG